MNHRPECVQTLTGWTLINFDDYRKSHLDEVIHGVGIDAPIHLPRGGSVNLYGPISDWELAFVFRGGEA